MSNTVNSLNEFFLVLTRLSPAFISSMGPFRYLPTMVRITVLLVFSLVVVTQVELLFTNKSIFNIFVAELILGFVVLFAFSAIYAGILFFGRLIDLQIGFGAAGIINPGTGSQEPLIGMAYLSIFSVLFFILGYHREFIAFWVNSFELIPLGTSVLEMLYGNIIPYLTSMFLLSFTLFAPVITIIWIVDVAIGAISKSMPQMNVYFVSLPFKIIIGLAALSFVILSSGPTLERIFSSIFIFLKKVLL